jgi:hypothetical protein
MAAMWLTYYSSDATVQNFRTGTQETHQILKSGAAFIADVGSEVTRTPGLSQRVSPTSPKHHFDQ